MPSHRFPHLSRRLALALPLAGAACALPVREPPVPRTQTAAATVLGLPNERFLPTRDGIAALDHEFAAAIERRRAARGGRMSELNLLAVSGGGENGAFGAGLLTAWTARGDRPAFDLVTGVSTGALTAPFAFLGPEWDPGLRDVYTNITLADVAASRGLLAALLDDALADTAPLFRTISRHLDERMMEALARAYREGRLLLIGSTNLDAQIPVIWNVGAIAASGHPRALDTIRRVLLASAAIPGAFPPVLFDVTVGGQSHQELHVDGGAVAQAFLYPSAVSADRRERIRRGQPVMPMRAWIIRNARLDPEWAAVERRTMGVAGRAISTMIASSGQNDVLRMWVLAQADRMDYNLAFIGTDFEVPYERPFDQGYMRALFAYGEQRMRAGGAWVDRPPALATPALPIR
ncbi:MAG: patatin-like phospholipase family protein [Acetobacteraceae bacterium]|nr:patatin-like phospholipase family protein [Acetobacteraceae bacterium]